MYKSQKVFLVQDTNVARKLFVKSPNREKSFKNEGKIADLALGAYLIEDKHLKHRTKYTQVVKFQRKINY